jgi:SAM-dependent methyltransferase
VVEGVVIEMTLKDLVLPLPGLRHVLMVRHRIIFRNSEEYWERRYARGGTSGVGSYGDLATGKAEFLNDFVRVHGIRSVVEFGCGDGNQLSLADYPSYLGLDVSRTAVQLCVRRFAGDPTKSFYLYDSDCFADNAQLFTADLALSLDVVQHLTADKAFEAHMMNLFAAGTRFIVIYGSNIAHEELSDVAPHVRNHLFTQWVAENCPDWSLVQVATGPRPEPNQKDFFVYERTAAVRG